MNYKAILLCIAALFLSVSVDASNPEAVELEAAKIARHKEIHRELEREATPFLVEGINVDIPIPRENIVRKNVTSAEIGIWEYLGDYSIIDLIAGLFSFLSLVFGCVYLLWKWNPLYGKKIK